MGASPPLNLLSSTDKLLEASKLVEMSVGGGAARLTLPHLAKDDEGLYTLRVFTKDGSTEHSAYLFVSGDHDATPVFTSLSSLPSFMSLCPRPVDAAPSAPGAPGAPMSVKAYDVNSDYVFVAWKPPNTVNEAPIVGYFVDRLVDASFSRKCQLSVLMMSSR